jgi:hypothetical protein
MSTSKLYIDPSRVAAAEKDDWAKFVFLARCCPWIDDVSSLAHPPFFVHLSARLPGSRTIISSMMPSCGMANYWNHRRSTRCEGPPLTSCARCRVRLSDTQPPHSDHSRARTVRRRMPGTHKRLPRVDHLSFSETLSSTGPKQPTTAWELKKVWPEIALHIVPDAGHSSREVGITKHLVEVRQFPITHLPTN